MPRRPQISKMVNQLLAGVIRLLRAGAGRQAQILVCDELLALCEQH